MTSQVNTLPTITPMQNSKDCRPPANFPKDYCQKMKSGLARLEASISRQYEKSIPGSGDRIARAIREAKEAAWSTPFPSLFFPVLAHLRVNEMIPSA